MEELTNEKIEHYRAEANRLDLEGRGLLWANSDLIRKVCNGIGAAWMAERLRKVLDKLHPAFVLPSLIHDLQYYYWDGMDSTFEAYNKEFAENGKKVARDLYAWYDPRRYLAYNTAARYKAVLDRYGHAAAVAAREERLKASWGGK